MVPTIKVGSLAFVTNTNANSLQVGDIIAFTSPIDSYQTILHRIYSINSDNIKTKGDSNNAPDAWTIKKENVLGKYLFSIPYLGFLAASIKTKLGFALIVGLPALFLVVLNLKEIYDGTKELKSKKVIIILVLLLVPLASAKIAQANFSSQASITGISISMKDQFTQGNCNIQIIGNGAGSINVVKCIIEDKRIVFQMSNVDITNIVNFILTYNADNRVQGVLGKVLSDTLSISTGICSSNNACTFPRDIKNVHLKLFK